MHKFENNWLFEREKIDNLSKSKFIIKKINSCLSAHDEVRIMDLGTGTGSNFRYLAKKIKAKKISWILIDISKESLIEVKKNILKNHTKDKISIINQNVIKNIDKIKFESSDLVSGSAFLDIMPLHWFKSFYKYNVNTKLIYFSINYDGYFKFYPLHKDDKTVLNLFNADQRSAKHKNDLAVGPNCTKLIEMQFKKTHKIYSYKSNWSVKNNKKFQLMFLNFCTNVLNKHNKDFTSWLTFRNKNIINNTSKLIVNNRDFLAVKF